MAQQHARLHELYERWVNNSATEPEKAELFSLMQTVNDPEALDAAMQELWLQQQDDQYFTPDKRGQLAHSILQAYRPQQEEEVVQPVHRVHFLRTAWFRYAAAVILLAGTGVIGWYLLRSPKQEVATITPSATRDIAPGGNKAVLTLADGTVIDLDKAANGKLATEGGAAVNKKEDGQLEYKEALSEVEEPGNGPERSRRAAFNTLKTPKGGQYQITLPDGTKVWLNAASSITYPTAFTGNERRVTMTGEIYLEVTKDKTKPFHVQFTHGGDRQYDIEVLGTHFNVNAYNDEPVASTTLLEGSVKVGNRQSAIGNEKSVVLKPGEQASLSQKSQSSHKIPVQTADIDQVMAWKNGAFNFNDKKLVEVMRQLSRWYNVDVIYENNNIPDKTFYGEMGRNLNLSQCLTILEKMQVHFRIEAGRKLVVMP